MVNPMGYSYPMMPVPPINLMGTPQGYPMNMTPVLSPRAPSDFMYHMPPQFCIDEPNLFVFHLPPEMDDEGLEGIFKEFGPIESAKVIVDKHTGDSKGYGFVQFVSRADAERALSMNGKSFGTKRLSVSFKTPSPRNSPRDMYPSPRDNISPRLYTSPRQYHRMSQ